MFSGTRGPGLADCKKLPWFIQNSLSLYSSDSEQTVATVFLRRFRTQAHLKTNVPLIERSFPPRCLNTGVDSGENCRRCLLQWLFFKYYRNGASAEYTRRICGHSCNYQRLFEHCIPVKPTHTNTHTPFLVFPLSKLKQRKQLKVTTGPVLSCSAAYKHAQASRK